MGALTFLMGAADGDLKLGFEMAGLLFTTVIGVFCLTVYIVGPAQDVG